MTLESRCLALVDELGLAPAASVRSVRPLAGGVASDIAVVELPNRKICVKFALPQLRVEADWAAPVHRNRAEYAWMAAARRVSERSIPELLGWSGTQFGFAMEYLQGPGVYLWKDALLKGAPGNGEAAAVGGVLGRVHAASAAPGFDRSKFDNGADFHALRIEPYLLHTADSHPGLLPHMRRLADMIASSRAVLVHGDVSPKNILLRDGGPVFLDAECATMADASFDAAFCLNHLALKAVHLPEARAERLADIQDFWDAYSAQVGWEDPSDLEARVAALLPALLLARVDGKSPVEYLSPASRAQIRASAPELVRRPRLRISAFVQDFFDAIE